MAQDPKDTIYIDVDDEITTIIDKLQSSEKKIIALVLPKRATVFQSIVNMKLLKRTADTSKKHVVLITSEAALMPLAGAVGVRVAKTLQSKPYIPDPPVMGGAAAEEDVAVEGKPLDKTAPIGTLAGLADDEPIEVDNSTPVADALPNAKAAKKAGKGKKIKIPNFDTFRKKAFLGGFIVFALLGLWVLAFMVLPKATVTLQTDTQAIETNLNIIADTNATELNKEELIIPATKKEFRKTDTEKVAATGEKNVGTKATGQIKLSAACGTGFMLTVPAGTSVNSGGFNFITDEAITLSSPEGDSPTDCTFNGNGSVTANENGAKFNIDSGMKFYVAGYSSVYGLSQEAFSGGSDKIVKVVKQEDIDKAKDAITKRAGEEAPKDLKDEFGDEGLYAVEQTLVAGEPTVTSTNKAGEEASDVTVTSTTVYTMLGVKEDDLKTVIEETANKNLDTAKQEITDNGLGSARIQVEGAERNGRTTLALQTQVVAGPKLDEGAIKREIVGKRRGEIQETLKQWPGINDVEVSYSPFWVQTTPKAEKKITIIFESSQEDGN